jgi:putative tricarboxylic transport membrane protein
MKEAALGNPNAPKMFPYGLGIIMIILGIISVIRERKRTQTFDETPISREHLQFIVKTLGVCFAYILLLHPLGYILATVFFLETALAYFNPKGKWKTNTIVSVVFSIIVYYLFTAALGIHLPKMPFIGI